MTAAKGMNARHLLAWLATFLLPTCDASAASVLPLTPFDKHSQTVCIGRHQMDLPADFEQSMGSVSVFTLPDQADTGAPISVAVKAARMDRAAFTLQVDQRHSAILGAARKATDILKEVITVSTEARIFRINEVDDAYKDEMHLWKDGVYLVASTASYDNTYMEAEARLKAFVAGIEVTASTPQSGFCLGPVVVKGTYVGEYGKFSYRSKNVPDVQVAVVIDTYARNEKKDLLQRVAGGDSLLTRMNARPTVLRKGELTVAGMRAQQWLSAMQVGRHGERKQYSFALETIRGAPAPLHPMIYLEFDTGRKGSDPTRTTSALSDEKALAFWDSIAKTIKARPGN